MIDIDKDELFRLHITEGKKIDDIADIYGVSHGTISKLFKQYNIPSKHSIGNDYEKAIGEYYPELDDYSFMYDLYINQGQSITDISKMYKKNCSYIRNKLLNLNIPIRKANDTRWGKVKKVNEESLLNYENLYDLFVTKEMSKEDISRLYGLYPKEVSRRLQKYKIYKTLRKKPSFFDKIPDEVKDEKMLRKLYLDELMSCCAIAKLYNIGVIYVKKLLKYYNIPMRTQKESAKILSGERSPHWKGVSYTLYEKIRAYSRDNLHKKVKERDNYTCQMCGKKENLQVHHIKPLWKIYYEILEEHPEYDKYEDIEELREIITRDERINDLNNLVTYCEDCHLFKVHKYTQKQVETLNKRRRLKTFQ